MRRFRRPCRAPLPALIACLFALGCGGQPGVDRGVVAGTGTVDPGAPNPFASLSASDDWPMWRGPGGDGIAEGQSVPTSLDEKSLLWNVRIPGRGHASPTIVADRIYVATADETAKTQSVLLDRESGGRVWLRELHAGGLDHPMHRESSHASGTVACDGERLFVAFLNRGEVHVSALDLEGNVLWQQVAGDFVSKFGYNPSPTIYKSSVVVAADHEGGGHITSWDRETGEMNWRIERPAVATYASPVVFSAGGRDLLLIAGANKLAAYDPVDGHEVWAADGTAVSCVGTPVLVGNLVVASGGYPEKETIAVDAASGEVKWRSRVACYVPSPLAHDGHVYAFDDDGTAHCLDAATGDVKWRERLGQKGVLRSSPTLAGGHLYITSTGGDCFVVEPNAERLVVVAHERVGDESYASPVACGNRLYFRVADKTNGRLEWLHCHGDRGTERADGG